VDTSKKFLHSPYPHKGKMKKNPPPTTPKLKSKKSRNFDCMLSLLIGCMKFLFSKLGVLVQSYPCKVRKRRHPNPLFGHIHGMRFQKQKVHRPSMGA
jgi:hypothetical protein